MNPQTFVFVGRSGCGKGTQAKLLQDALKNKHPEGEIFYIETGANFRKFLEEEKYSNQLSKDVYKKGERQPDFLAIWMWSNVVLDKVKGQEHLFFDGIARSLPEAMTFTTAMEFYERTVNVVYLDVSREWSEEKLLARGRSDDQSLEEIKRRLDWFDKDSYPAVEYFDTHKRYNVLKINGEQTVDEVHQEILTKLGW